MRAAYNNELITEQGYQLNIRLRPKKSKFVLY